jgi:cytochrome c551/c552
MDFINEFILPASSEHLDLLNLLLLLNLAVLIPFMALQWGHQLLSLLFIKLPLAASDKGQLSPFLLSFMRDKPSYAIAFSALPVLALLTIFTQLMAAEPLTIYPLFIIATVLFVMAQVAMFFAGRDAHLGQLILAILLQSLAILLVFAAYSGIMDGGRQEALRYLFSPATWLRFSVYFIVALSLSSAFALWRNQRLGNDQITSAGKRWLALISLGGLVILPVWAGLAFFTVPVTTYSASVFLFLSLALVFGVIIALIYYQMASEPEQGYSGAGFFLFMAALFMVFGADHALVEGATAPSTRILYAEAEAREAAAKAKEVTLMTLEEMLVAGEQTYNSLCIACHKFDERLVGPPYNSVLPKYAENPEAMEAYIRNPQRINEDYPPMPAQPLKAQEAKAVVAYLLKRYEEQQQ